MYEGIMEDGLRRKAESSALTVHLPTKSVRDTVRYYMIQSFPKYWLFGPENRHLIQSSLSDILSQYFKI